MGFMPRSSWGKRGLCLLLVLAFAAAGAVNTPFEGAAAIAFAKPVGERSFEIGASGGEGNLFLKDGAPFFLHAGSIHYSRVHPSLWRDRLERLRAMGLNAITTYVPWNVHQPAPEVFDFDGGASNVVAFLRKAQEVGLLVVLRAGPYMCGEWDFGGLPPWLMSVPDMQLRTWNDAYIRAVRDYWDQLLPLLKSSSLLYQDGGPIVMMQVENEFGSYGDVEGNENDAKYMEFLVGLAREHLGKELILFTTDGDGDGYLSHGTLQGSRVFSTVDFGPGANLTEAWAVQGSYNDPGRSPPMNTEFYTGWLTHWGESIANTSSTAVANSLAEIVEYPANFNLYMAHGGSSFGFGAGANANGDGTNYLPDIQSYDYNAPVAEGGEHGIGSDGIDKYAAIQQVLLKGAGAASEPPLPPRTKYPDTNFSHCAFMGSRVTLSTICVKETKGLVDLCPMETFDQYYGLIIYSRQLENKTPLNSSTLTFASLPHDRAQIYTNEWDSLGIVEREGSSAPISIMINVSKPSATLRIAVENLGRIGYGHGMEGDFKGLQAGSVMLDGEVLRGGWDVMNIPIQYAQVGNVSFQPFNGSCVTEGQPVFLKASLTIASEAQVTDTYLDVSRFGRGYVWINGFMLGRYVSTKGPQMTIYVPSALLRAGVNEVIFLELEPLHVPSATISFSEVPIFNNPTPAVGGRTYASRRAL